MTSATVVASNPAAALEALLGAQRAAFAADMSPTFVARDDRLARLAHLLAKEADRFAELISQDFGNRHPIVSRMGDLMTACAAIRHARRHLKRWMRPQRVPTGLASKPGRSTILRQPLGVIGVIAPWNYPLVLLVAPLVGILAAGNRAMLKPSELTPRFAEGFAKAIAARFAEDEVAVVMGDAEVGQAFAALPFDHLVFTGSTRVGRLVAQAAAKNLTPVTLELGGKSPVIVDASADLALAAERIAWGKTFNAGQTCIAPDYALVPGNQVEAFVDALRTSVSKMFPTIASNADYTSIIGESHLTRLQSLIDDAKAKGARVVDLAPLGSDLSSRRLAPVALLDVDDMMSVMQEEIFGPILPVLPYDSLDEAIAAINAKPRPLSLYWFGSDATARDAVLTRTLSGGVTINDTIMHIAQEDLPFGGVGPSGTGHYHGIHGFRQFSKEKGVFVQSRFAGGSLLYPPYNGFKRQMARLLTRFG